MVLPERRAADWLAAYGSDCRYDDKVRIIRGDAVRPDVYLPVYDVDHEYRGLDTTDDKVGILMKQPYQQGAKQSIPTDPEDLNRLDDRSGLARRTNDVGRQRQA